MTRDLSPASVVATRTFLRRERLLPLGGEVLVRVDDEVAMGDVVATARRPGSPVQVRAAGLLGVPAGELGAAMLVGDGDSVEEGQLLAEVRGFLGLLHKRVLSPIRGTVESISKVTGQIILRPVSEKMERLAFLPGRVVEVVPNLGVVLEGEATWVQGIFGIGGEVVGQMVRLADTGAELLDRGKVKNEHRGAVVLAGGHLTLELLERLREIEVAAVVAASASGPDLFSFAGQTLNLAATGGETGGPVVVLTEGFGRLDMAARTFDILAGLEKEEVAVSGVTQVRAGVVRPEVVATPRGEARDSRDVAVTVEAGTRVRVVRGEAFGEMVVVVEIPKRLEELPSGARALVYVVEADGGRRMVVPRANTEMV